MRLKTETIPIIYRERLGESKLSAVQDGYRIGTTILAMLTLYNPTLLFVIPGLLVFGLSTLVVMVLSVQSISVGPLLLSTNTLLSAGMLSLAGFEIATFGVALNLYGQLHKSIQQDRIGGVLCRVFQSSWLAVFASSALLSSISLSTVMWLSWALGGFGSFEHTSTLFLGAYMGILGLQLLLSSLFLSPLLDDLRAVNPTSTLLAEVAEPRSSDDVPAIPEEASARAA
jgi:hypothetical protein